MYVTVFLLNSKRSNSTCSITYQCLYKPQPQVWSTFILQNYCIETLQRCPNLVIYSEKIGLVCILNMCVQLCYEYILPVNTSANAKRFHVLSVQPIWQLSKQIDQYHVNAWNKMAAPTNSKDTYNGYLHSHVLIPDEDLFRMYIRVNIFCLLMKNIEWVKHVYIFGVGEL